MEISATELRIGNYIYHPIHGMGKVSAISGLDILYDRNYDSLSIELMEGVPLTEEWLMKLGFDVLNVAGWCIEGWITLKIYDKTSYFFESKDDSFFKIRHVHQLQNLYHALTGNELTIKEPIETN